MPSPNVTPVRAGPFRRGDRVLLPADRLGDLLAALRARGYRVIGPRVRDGAVVHEELASADDLPRGVGDSQAPGRHRLHPRADGAFFGHRPGPQPWRHQLHPQRQKLLEARAGESGGFAIVPEPAPAERLAFVGVRPCDLRAIAVQDRVLAHGAVADPHYVARRDGLFVVAVSCTEPGAHCFCASMGAGPRVPGGERPRTAPPGGEGAPEPARVPGGERPRTAPPGGEGAPEPAREDGGFDLALTELVEPAHRFVAEVGTDAGGALASELALAPAAVSDVAAAAAATERAALAMGRTVDTTGLPELLAGSAGSPRWEQIARRCLSCTSCTLVCPTCYCTNVVDRADLSGEVAVRWRRWDSCHTMRHSYIHGGSVRPSAAGRYRHWLTHKLSTWKDQFGTLGCVGCGRCISWCPAGIDLTEEVAALRATDAAARQEVSL
jgi:sulfhydrogenase subunit beta (sulfur reductase)